MTPVYFCNFFWTYQIQIWPEKALRNSSPPIPWVWQPTSCPNTRWRMQLKSSWTALILRWRFQPFRKQTVQVRCWRYLHWRSGRWSFRRYCSSNESTPWTQDHLQHLIVNTTSGRFRLCYSQCTKCQPGLHDIYFHIQKFKKSDW